jgi:hypothetical protein
MNRIVVLAVLTLLSGCGGMSKVVRAGPDTYMVSSGGGMYEQNPSGIRQEVYEAANAHCDKMGKKMEPVNVDERPYALGRHTASISLTFKCI